MAPTRPLAPSDADDPTYDWAPADTVLTALRKQGIEVLLQLDGAPRWANGGKPRNYPPTSRLKP